MCHLSFRINFNISLQENPHSAIENVMELAISDARNNFGRPPELHTVFLLFHFLSAGVGALCVAAKLILRVKNDDLFYK
jgi:hypothetical protein